jgi:hypothetical protein
MLQPSGFGAQDFSDGSVYEGAWLQDARHGVGVFTTATGSCYAGTWVHGELQGLALVTTTNAEGTAVQRWSRCIGWVAGLVRLTCTVLCVSVPCCQGLCVSGTCPPDVACHALPWDATYSWWRLSRCAVELEQ